MKTYTYVFSLVLAFSLIACSTSNSEAPSNDLISTSADYHILLKGASGLTSSLLNFDGTNLKPSEKQNLFSGFQIPEVSYRTGYQYSFYGKIDDCTGEVMLYDFQENAETSFSVFEDLGTCDINIRAMAHSSTHVFLAYGTESLDIQERYFIRSIATNSETYTYEDVEISAKPLQLVVANNRIFIETISSDDLLDKNLSVMEIGTNEFIHEMDLGFNVGRIFTKPSGDIIITYPELHTTLNSRTLSTINTRYNEGTAPDFYNTASISFDISGSMYYPMPYNGAVHVPATYDFSNKTAVLYVFENFLTPTQLNVEYHILEATAIGYDEKNNFMLVGYKKKGESNRGGLLRIATSPNFSFIDNYNLEAIPMAVFAN